MASLIVMEKGERGLVKKTLLNFTLKAGGLLALNGNFIASVKEAVRSELDTKIALWGGDKRLSDVILPGRMPSQSVIGIIFEAPYVILSLFKESVVSTFTGKVTIKVYSVSSSKQMEKISSQGCLLKSIPIPGSAGDPRALRC